MRTLWLLMVATSIGACAQTPQELLRLAQDAYKNPSGYEIKGRGSVQPAGSSWQATFNVTVAAAPAPLETPNAPASPGGQVGGGMQWTNVGGGADEKPKGLGIPFAVTSGWSRIAENVVTVKEIGAEQLKLNGSPVDCRELDVEYNAPADEPKPAPVSYFICSGKHLVLKKVMLYSTGRRPTDPGAAWTITFDTAQFHRPAPAWLLDLKNAPTISTRNEWMGKPAPAFQLTDLDGKSVELSSMRGRVVLLDFWSTSCGPCIREMPSIQKVAEEHKDDVSVWGVSLDQPNRDKKWLAEHQQEFPTLSDSDYMVSDLYKVHGIPAAVLIDRNGKIRNYWEGEVPLHDLEAALRRAVRTR
jgi:cytochrome c biogenesis protein CcmG/thiol:disulfide interchange protein DsbE